MAAEAGHQKEYAAAKAGAAAAENTAAGTAKAAQGAASMTEKAFQFVQSHSHIIIGIAAVGLLVLVIAGSVSSCSVLINGGGNVVLGTSYTAEDEDLKGVETDYTKLEDKLRKKSTALKLIIRAMTSIATIWQRSVTTPMSWHLC